MSTPVNKGPHSSGPVHDFAAVGFSRITRQPGSSLRFAAFDSDTATGDPTNFNAFRKLTLNEELCRPKRIVVETTPQGTSTWRFVPNASREPGVEDEGVWPRVVNVCGEFRTLTQDEWDLYKLDPAFECLIRVHPRHSTVTRREMPPPSLSPKPEVSKSLPGESRGEGSSATSQLVRSKRRLSVDTIARRLSGSNSVGQRKKARIPSDPLFSGGEYDENAEEDDMITDNPPPSSRRRPMAERLKKVRANRDEARRKLREEMAKRKNPMSGLDIVEDNEDVMSWAEIPIETSQFRPKLSPSPTPKRKVECFSDDDSQFLESSEDEKSPRRFRNYEWTGKSKKTRTVSPEYARKKVEMKKKKREAARKLKLDARKRARSEAKHECWMKQLFDEAARCHSATPSTDTTMATDLDPFSLNSDNSMPHAETVIDQMQYAQQEPQYAEFFNSDEQCAEAIQQEMPYSNHAYQERPDDGQPGYAEQFNQETPYRQSWDSSQETHIDDEARHMASIEESRRKLAELEKDRPLWEEQARKRAILEAEERARAEAAREAKRAADSKEKEKEAIRGRAEQEAQRESERETVAAELRNKRENARNLALKEDRTWLAKGWCDQLAIERYLALCNSFDVLNFAKGDVIVFETIPWPVLKKPGRFGVEDIDWASVEEFFLKASFLLPSREYRALVEKSHKRFHPDRWLSRRVLQSVEDEEEKECLEIAANTVAQALTPVWQAVR